MTHRAESCMKEESIRLQLLRPTLGSHLSSVAARPDVEYHSRSMRKDPNTMEHSSFATTRRGWCSGTTTTLVDTIDVITW